MTAGMLLNSRHYLALGIPYGSDAKRVRKAYHTLALQWHPDKHVDPHEKEHATKQFQAVQEAYEALCGGAAVGGQDTTELEAWRVQKEADRRKREEERRKWREAKEAELDAAENERRRRFAERDAEIEARFTAHKRRQSKEQKTEEMRKTFMEEQQKLHQQVSDWRKEVERKAQAVEARKQNREAQQKKFEDCVREMKAWADALGSAAEQRAEEQRQAAQVEVQGPFQAQAGSDIHFSDRPSLRERARRLTEVNMEPFCPPTEVDSSGPCEGQTAFGPSSGKVPARSSNSTPPRDNQADATDAMDECREPQRSDAGNTETASYKFSQRIQENRLSENEVEELKEVWYQRMREACESLMMKASLNKDDQGLDGVSSKDLLDALAAETPSLIEAEEDVVEAGKVHDAFPGWVEPSACSRLGELLTNAFQDPTIQAQQAFIDMEASIDRLRCDATE